VKTSTFLLLDIMLEIATKVRRWRAGMAVLFESTYPWRTAAARRANHLFTRFVSPPVIIKVGYSL